MTLTDLPEARASEAPDELCITDDSGTYTNSAFARRVRQAAAALAASGIRRGDVVAVKLPNRIELIIAVFAAWRLGAVVTPINPALGEAETTFQITDSGAAIVIMDPDAEPDAHWATQVVPVGSLAGEREPAVVPVSPEDIALLIYTSGTTGSPKGVMLTHANLDAMTSSFIEWFALGPHDHSLLVLPLFHANGIVLGTLSPLRAGGRVTIVGRFSRDRFFSDVEKHRPTFFSAVPAIYAMLSALPDEVQPDTSSLRFAVCGAAPMPADLIRRCEERFGFTIVEGYGLSETTTASTINPLDGVRKPGFVGLPLPGQRVQIVGLDGRPVRAGERGEVVIAGPVVMAGYLNRPDATAEAIVDGWLHTGDIGRFDDDGYLQIVDRVKDMIIRGGENVYPKEIENAIYLNEDVLETAVVGRHDDVMGEVPVAYVTLRAPGAVTPDQLMDLCATHLAGFKRPVAVHVVEEIPKNAVGKIDKRRLRTLADST
ncbi:MAG: AMP-dependent synthetase [Herbiconiux sp.]|uniref:class I adenylate-forming enzyme family protein n=1 Tax=Herbiconiux sp. TaxID=1871186 RepID=UPI001213F305|nr:AMP-binding protein [Herbiconiux sp.]TAJ49471.1 MAG: AMP-dependent synthetase [Herbiconiux sp.]